MTPNRIVPAADFDLADFSSSLPQTFETVDFAFDFDLIDLAPSGDGGGGGGGGGGSERPTSGMLYPRRNC